MKISLLLPKGSYIGIGVFDILNNDAMDDDSKMTRVMTEFEMIKKKFKDAS